jgi:hypothetical protein
LSLWKAGRSICDPTKDMLVELGNEPEKEFMVCFNNISNNWRM